MISTLRMDESILHPDDATSVDIHVQKLLQEDPDCILVYKPIRESFNMDKCKLKLFAWLHEYSTSKSTRHVRIH